MHIYSESESEEIRILQLYCNWGCNGGGGGQSQPTSNSFHQLSLLDLQVAGLRKVMARPGIQPRSPPYMADALSAELLTTPAEMSAGTMTDGSCT